jgi:Zn-dependent M28 family amino/carboxypeptidase
MRLPLLFLAIAVVTQPVLAQTKFGNNAAITPSRLRAHLELIASDELEGRDTPSRGLDVATLYVATQLKLWGAKPAGDNGTFFQKIPLTSRAIDRTGSTLQFGGKTYSYGASLQAGNVAFQGSGKMVYCGHGFVVKSKNLDPYAGLDVKGKIVVIATGMPAGVSFSDLRLPGSERPAQAAKARGAMGVLIVADASDNTSWNPDEPVRRGFMQPDYGDAPDAPGPSIRIRSDVAAELFAGESTSVAEILKGSDAPEKGFALNASKTVIVNILEQKTTIYTRNVVAIVPGSDPKLAGEFVAYGAHIDHVGVRTGGTGDMIYNGADDDGSGTVGILEIAHALLIGPRPKRSSLFVWHCGEEKGMWGSEWYVEKPTVGLKSIVAQLNIDMIGRSKPAGDTNPANKVLTGPNEVYVVGSTMMSTDLQKTSESVNKKFLNIAFNYKYDDPKDTERIFFRSDHYSYAKKGIPIIFYFDGVHEDYHRVGDEPQKIDYEKLSKVTRTVYATGWELANAPKRPVVDKGIPK